MAQHLFDSRSKFKYFGIPDVSWRYTANHGAVRARRQEVREDWLTKALLKLSENIQKNFDEDRKKKITERRFRIVLVFIQSAV